MGTTRYDDFARPMNPQLVVDKINAAFGGIDPHDHASAGRGGTIPGSAISGAVAEATHATSADNATHAISADNATHATSADNGVPVGTIFPYAGSTAPSDYLLCFGQAVSRTTYSALFAIINTTYGVGDGSTTFNVPDMRGRVPVGLDNMGGISANRVVNAQADILGGSGGEENHALIEAENGRHGHGILAKASTTAAADALAAVTDEGPTLNTTTGLSGNGTPHNNMQPWLGVNYIIKYK